MAVLRGSGAGQRGHTRGQEATRGQGQREHKHRAEKRPLAGKGKLSTNTRPGQPPPPLHTLLVVVNHNDEVVNVVAIGVIQYRIIIKQRTDFIGSAV